MMSMVSLMCLWALQTEFFPPVIGDHLNYLLLPQSEEQSNPAEKIVVDSISLKLFS